MNKKNILGKYFRSLSQVRVSYYTLNETICLETA